MQRAESESPPAPEVVVDALPTQLKAVARWVGWRYRRGSEKWRKVPIDARTGRAASTADPAKWGTFEAALRSYRERGLDGLGFVFAEGDPYTGIDLDACRDSDTGTLEPWADEIVRDLDSYTEVSPSGTGVKVFVEGRPTPGTRRRKGGIEVYSRDKFFTVTGTRLEWLPATVEAREEPLERLCGRLQDEEPPGAPTSGGTPWAALTDAEIVSKLGRGRDKLARLWAGDATGYESASEADLTLCGMLAWRVGADAGRVERLFNLSGLAKRGKWSQRADYRQWTVEAAIEGPGMSVAPRVLTSVTKRSREPMRITSEQEQSRNTHTTPGGVLAVVTRDEPHGKPDNPEEWGQGDAIRLALDLADTRGNDPDWEVSFGLARRLRTLSPEAPEQFEPAVAAFCERTGRPFEDFWYAFLDSWDKVKVAEGDDELAWAAKEAEKSPVAVSPCPGPLYGRTATIAHHLARRTAPEPFLLPVKRVVHHPFCKFGSA